MVICPDCGREVEKDKFCRNCGAYLGDIEEAELTESQPQMLGEKTSPDTAPALNYKYCYNCGTQLSDNFKFCPECGVNLSSDIVKTQPVQASPMEKNTLLAVILSVFMPGLGHIYLGLDNKGAIFLIAYVVSAILILLLIGFLLVVVIWMWALIDTIISANALNRGEEVKDKLF